MDYKRQLILLCTVASLSLFYFVKVSHSVIYASPEPKLLSCESVLESLQPPFPALLIDHSFLKEYEQNSCIMPKTPLLIAVEEKSQPDLDRYEIIIYSPENLNKNYWTFYDKNNVTRAIPVMATYRLGNFVIPYNSRLLYEFWKRSSFVPCLNLDMKRASTKSYLPPKESVLSLKKLTDLLLSFNMFPFLCGGTILGWYRECGIIPHTWDMDLAVQIEHYNPKFLEQLENGQADFKLTRKLGKVEDSFELTVIPSSSKIPSIDIFFMYNNGRNESWVGGTSVSGAKFKYTYPLYDPWCSADLLGELFWVTCMPDKMIPYEYGKFWKKDHPTSNYAWDSSGSNVKKNGKWNKSELKSVYVIY